MLNVKTINMKKATLVLITFLLLTQLKAQYETKIIDKGTLLDYEVTPYRSFVRATLLVEHLAADSVIMRWSINDLGGRRTMSRKSIDNASLGYWAPPTNGEDIVIPEQQTLLCISRSSFVNLKQTGLMEFDGQVLEMINTYDPLVYEVSGKKIPAIRAESVSGTTRIWISDDAFFPVILKLEGNPFHVDLVLTGIR
jgi:hypothetical protein